MAKILTLNGHDPDPCRTNGAVKLEAEVMAEAPADMEAAASEEEPVAMEAVATVVAAAEEAVEAVMVTTEEVAMELLLEEDTEQQHTGHIKKTFAPDENNHPSQSSWGPDLVFYSLCFVFQN